MTITDEVFEKFAEGIRDGLTVGYVNTKEVLWLNDENPESLGICKLFDSLSPLIKYKGELFLTKYRLVFSEKTLLMYPLMVSFWFKPNFKGKTFQIKRGVLKAKYVEYKDLILDIELKKGLPSIIELVVKLVHMDNTIAKWSIINPKYWSLNKPKLFDMIKNARDSALEISVDTLIDYLKNPEVNPNQFRYGHNE